MLRQNVLEDTLQFRYDPQKTSLSRMFEKHLKLAQASQKIFDFTAGPESDKVNMRILFGREPFCIPLTISPVDLNHPYNNRIF